MVNLLCPYSLNSYQFLMVFVKPRNMKKYSYSLIFLSFLLFLPQSSNAQSPSKLDPFIQSQIPAVLEEHRSFVSIPCDNRKTEDMLKNIEWLEKAFQKRGFETKALKTPTIPVFFAQKIVDDNLPTVLFYMHFDGQPIDPSKWNQEHPFTPVIKFQNKNKEWEVIDYRTITNQINPEWRIYGRAAADDKGPILMFLSALDLMKERNKKPVFNIKILLDGEEERGSEGLKSTLDQYKEIYDADYLIIMDGPAHPTNQPTLTFGCRGIASGAITVYGPKVPQHSGHFGNYAPNPVFRMSHLLASMKDEDGKVLINGFYDGINLNEETLAVLDNVPDDERSIQNRIGVAEAEKVGRNYQESLQYPSLNIRGMASAWISRQTRTIVPDKATAQFGIRLVKESDGERLLELVKKHIESRGYYVINREPTDKERLKYPKICTMVGKKSVNAFRTDLDSDIGIWLSNAIKKVHHQDPVRIRTMGGTVPVTPIIESLNLPAVIVPMVNMDNNQHSPNENLRLGNLIDGIKTCYGILTEEIQIE
jgi:acetylornithine deacetylase/succinyl-diaminopimelate desuccinylase-like protein